jgi:SAM-dependent methyltransferase
MGDEEEAGEAPPALEEVPPLSDEDFQARQPIFDEIFAGCAAQDLKGKSIAERKENGLEDKALTYSEIDFSLMNQILNTVKTNFGPVFEKGVFLDLGSGVGKACVAAALQHPFEKVVGVETLQSLSDIAATAAGKYGEAQLPEGVQKPELQLIKGDFVSEFEAHIEPVASQVTVLFVVATCYGEKEVQAMVNVARKMPENSFVISFTQGLPESFVVDTQRHPMQRRAAAVRKACSKRGVEICPASEVEVPDNGFDKDGFTMVHKEAVQVPWGTPATVFVYKKVPLAVPEEEAATDEVPEQTQTD